MADQPGSSPIAEPPITRLDRVALLDPRRALELEWLLANGLGGYASGTVLGIDTRRYHGLLVAALDPPGARTLLLARLHERLEAGDDSYALHAAEYHDGTIHPAGYIFLEEFRLEGTRPVWRYRCRDVELEKSIWLEHGRNTVFVEYRLLAAVGRVRLRIEPFVAHRGHHDHQHGDPQARAVHEARDGVCRIEASPGATPLWMRLAGGGACAETGLWYWRFLHRRERERGLDDVEDLYTPHVLAAELGPGESVALVASTHEEDLALDPSASLRRERERQAALLARANARRGDTARARLVLAADQFLVESAPDPTADRRHAPRAAIAGYHWFGALARDALVALPGLYLATGRAREARRLLVGAASRLDQGVLPTVLADPDGPPAHTAVDGTLWLFDAIGHYERVTQDRSLVDELLPALRDALAWYRRGTHQRIGVDPADGLLAAAAPVAPVSWMDATIGDWVMTPRHGKPVEVQALWYNALTLLAEWLGERGEPTAEVAEVAELCRQSFTRRFWNPSAGCLLDLVDGPGGDDASVRPNQVFAASLPHAVLHPTFWGPVLEVVEAALLTPVGLRTLAPAHADYVGAYAGDQARRDGAYHQGSVWPWLLGAYVDLARRVRGAAFDPRPALAGLAAHLEVAGLGQIGEVFDGDPPHLPGGCIARAWGVAEALRVWPVA